MYLRRISTITVLFFLIACTTQTSPPFSVPTGTPVTEPAVVNPLMGINWNPHPAASNLIQGASWTCNPQVRLREGMLYLAGNDRNVLIENDFGQMATISGGFRIRATIKVNGSTTNQNGSGGIAILTPDTTLDSEPQPILLAGIFDGQLGVKVLDEQTGELVDHLSDPPLNISTKMTFELIGLDQTLYLLANGVEIENIALPGSFIKSQINFGIFAGPQSETWVSSLGMDTRSGEEAFILVKRPQFNLKDLPAELPLRCYAELRGKKIGVAFNNFMYTFQTDRTTLEKAAREFDVIFPVGTFDFNVTRPWDEHTYNEQVFGVIDDLIKSGELYDYEVYGQPLLFWQATPEWLCKGKYTREQMLDILKDQIDTVMGRSKGKIPFWSVVNEPLESEPRMLVDKCRGTYYKWDIWYENVGAEYLDLAYQWAHEADSDAKLIINENAADGLGQRSNDFYDLVKGLIDRGVPIEGVGLQMHLIADYYVPSSESIAANIERFADLGLDVYITEMDVMIDHEPQVPLDIRLERQAKIYKDVLTVCLQEPGCKMFMVFNLSDADIWLREPTGLPDGLSMFDENFEPKPAYFAIRDALRNTPIP